MHRSIVDSSTAFVYAFFSALTNKANNLHTYDADTQAQDYVMEGLFFLNLACLCCKDFFDRVRLFLCVQFALLLMYVMPHSFSRSVMGHGGWQQHAAANWGDFASAQFLKN